MTPPRAILDRAERVLAYHQATKHTAESVRRPGQSPDWAHRPSAFRVFPQCPKIPLPTTLLDAPVDAIQLLTEGLEALPQSQVTPPQNLKTLASWLHLADGLTASLTEITPIGPAPIWARTCPSSGGTFPFEIYVAAFNLADLEPGLYHYEPREFCLRRLRHGPETLSLIKRGRPDLEFVKDCPAVLLASTIFCRPAWRFHGRGYRYALIDAGHLAQNLVTSAQGLGIQTVTRLRVNDGPLRELIGVAVDADFAEAEAVQAMIVWADRAGQVGQRLPRRRRTEQRWAAGSGLWEGKISAENDTSLDDSDVPHMNLGSGVNPTSTTGNLLTDTAEQTTARPVAQTTPVNMAWEGTMSWEASPEVTIGGPAALELIARPPLATAVTPYGSILAAHADCVSAGAGPREIRPPYTELSPLSTAFAYQKMQRRDDPRPAQSLRQTLRSRRRGGFTRGALAVDDFLILNQLAFCGGTFYPLAPAGPHVALVRPFWIINAVSGMTAGLWYYHCARDDWSLLQVGDFRRELSYLALEQEWAGESAAACFLFSPLHQLSARAGPDAYRLAHLEAGVVGQRLGLAATALGLGAAGVGAFYDDEVRQFFGLGQTRWEPVYAIALGVPASDQAKNSSAEQLADGELSSEPSGGWRD